MGHPDLEDYVMASSQGDKPLTIQRVNQMLKVFKHKYRLNIETFLHIHSARHSADMCMTQTSTAQKACCF